MLRKGEEATPTVSINGPLLLGSGASESERWQTLGVGPQRKLKNG